MEVVADVGDAAKSVAATVAHAPDVCLLDIHMPANGIQAAADIAAQAPDTVVVMMTASRDDEDLFEALRVGADGYLLKDRDLSSLAAALRGVMLGEAALPPALVQKVMEEFRGRSKRHLRSATHGARLTSREWQVLDVMAGRASSQEIADQLGMSVSTVRRHVRSILRKLHVPDRDAAITLLRGED